MINYRSAFAHLRWMAGEVLPGHQFKIHDFAVWKSNGQTVLLTGLLHNRGEQDRYRFIELDSLDVRKASIADFDVPERDKIKTEYKLLRGKLFRIIGYPGPEQFRKILKHLSPDLPEEKNANGAQCGT